MKYKNKKIFKLKLYENTIIIKKDKNKKWINKKLSISAQILIIKHITDQIANKLLPTPVLHLINMEMNEPKNKKKIKIEKTKMKWINVKSSESDILINAW